MERCMDRGALLINMVRASGVAVIVMGLVLIAGMVTFEIFGSLFAVVGVIAILIGLLLIRGANKAMRRYRKRSLGVAKDFAVVLLATILLFGTPIYAQFQVDPVQLCKDAYFKTLYVEYLVMALLAVSGFLALAPVILGRTILGPILGEFQYIAGAMLILLIFVALLMIPIHVAFSYTPPSGGGGGGWGGGQETCEIKICNLAHNGPPLLRMLFSLLGPVNFGC